MSLKNRGGSEWASGFVLFCCVALVVFVVTTLQAHVSGDSSQAGPALYRKLRIDTQSRAATSARQPPPLPSAEAGPPPAAALATPSRVVSNPVVLATYNTLGARRKFYYRFQNVQLERDSVTVFYPPGFQPPPEQWVDTGFNNATLPSLPTGIIVREYHYRHRLRVRYLPAAQHQPNCSRWVEAPVYAVQLPVSDNIWHVFNDGVGGAFQSLRELRLLQLAEVVDDDGRMVPPKKEPWCRKGALVSADRASAPILLALPGSNLNVKQWRHLYQAITDNRMEWEDSLGLCYRDLVVGKPSTINYYLPMRAASSAPTLPAFRFARGKATAAYKRFLMSAEQERHARRAGRQKHVAPWEHSDTAVERLRRGVGPDEIEAVQAVKPTAKGAQQLAEMSGPEILELQRAWNASDRLVRRLVRERAAAAAGAPPPPQYRNFSYEFERPRPVVTYMWRPTLRRSVLNPHDILAYILLRYNVTVRVTTLQEPLLEVAQLLASTDVLLGMHGAAWTNALLVKRGAAAMQLLPYGYTMQPEGKAIRGGNYWSLAVANDCAYAEWTNARRKNAFLRRRDFWSASKKQGSNITYTLHPDPEWPMPVDTHPGHQWIYQNTFVDMEDFADHLDRLMLRAGIPPAGTTPEL